MDWIILQLFLLIKYNILFLKVSSMNVAKQITGEEYNIGTNLKCIHDKFISMQLIPISLL